MQSTSTHLVVISVQIIMDNKAGENRERNESMSSSTAWRNGGLT